MMTWLCKLGLVLMLALTLSWGQPAIDAHVHMGDETASEHVSGGHNPDADVDPAHLAHHSCHHHLSDRTLMDPVAVAMTPSSLTYLSASELGWHGIAVGPLSKPPATA